MAPTVEPKTLSCWYFTSANPACKALLPNQADTFALPAQFTYGNLGRNTLRGDRLVQLDMSLIKKFKLTESKSFEFRAQVFNLTNTREFRQPERQRESGYGRAGDRDTKSAAAHSSSGQVERCKFQATPARGFPRNDAGNGS